MPRISYVNGQYRPHHDATVHIEDRGYQFADGVYEVIAFIDGVMADERGHLDRLERSLAELQIAMPVPRRTLSLIMREVLRRNRLRNAGIYIQVTRGVAKRDFAFPASIQPNLIITARAFNFNYSTARDKGWRVITVPDLRWKRVDIKTIGLLAQAMAKGEAVRRGVQDAWLVDEKGFITEASAANAWIVNQDGVLITRPPHGNGILKGVTRNALLTLKDIKFEERAFTVDEAYAAREAFSSAATNLIAPVVEIDGRKIGDGKPGPIAARLYQAYRDYVRSSANQYSWSQDK